MQAQHGRILDSISRAFEDARDKYDAHFASSARRGTATGDDVMAASIKAAVDALEQPDTEALLSESHAYRVIDVLNAGCGRLRRRRGCCRMESIAASGPASI